MPRFMVVSFTVSAAGMFVESESPIKKPMLICEIDF